MSSAIIFMFIKLATPFWSRVTYLSFHRYLRYVLVLVVLWWALYTWWLGWRSWVAITYHLIENNFLKEFWKYWNSSSRSVILGIQLIIFLVQRYYFKNFQLECNFCVERESLSLWVRAGVIDGLTSFMMKVSIRSKLKELEFFPTSSGCTGTKEKVRASPHH